MRLHPILPLLLASLSTACGSTGGGTDLPTTLCTPGTRTCLGNYLAMCDEDGRAWTDLATCSPDGACQEGECTARVCNPPGANRCDSRDVALLCSADGMIATRLPCPKFQSCYGGACLPDECDPGRDGPICTFDTRVTCEAGTRTALPCPEGTACVGTECAPIECTPEEARCSGDTVSGVCRLNGTGWDATVCTAAQHCVGGFCLARLADLPPEVIEDVSLDVPDEASLDTASDEGVDADPTTDIPVLAPNRAELNGTRVDFDFLPLVSVTPGADKVVSQVAILLLSGRTLDVPLPSFPDEGASISLEVVLVDVPVDDLAGLVGTYACDATEGPRARLWLRYGLHASGSEGACKNYDFGAGLCTVTVTDGGSNGSRILKGTFEAPGMADCLAGTGLSVTVTEGAFEVEVEP